MAINFPPPPGDKGDLIDGDYYTDTETGRQWQYDASIDAWRAAGNMGPGIIYRGPIDLNVDPNTQYANIESGNLFAVTSGTANVNTTWYPGLSGQILAPAELVYGGNPGVWSILSGSVPYATESTPGRIQIATQGEVTAGTDATKAVVPAYLKTVIDAINIPDGLPTGGVEGQFLGHGVSNPEWKNLPNAQTGKAGITRYATEAEVNQVTDTNGTYVDNAAVTPNSLKGIFGNWNIQWEALLNWISGTNTRLDTAESEIDALQTDVGNLQTDVSNLDTTLTNHIGSGGDAHALATDTTAGFMSATDKAKLDNYPTTPSGTLPYPDSDGYYPVGGIGCFKYSSGSQSVVDPGKQITIGSDGFLTKVSLDGSYTRNINSPRENEKWVALTPTERPPFNPDNPGASDSHIPGLWMRIS